MNRKTLPLCSLVLAASLAACAPMLSGPLEAELQTKGVEQTYKPDVVGGLTFPFATKIPVEQITDATPGTTYATFADCVQVAVSVADVRKLGVQAADAVCRDISASVGRFTTFSQVLGALAALPLFYFSYVLFQTLLGVFGGH